MSRQTSIWLFFAIVAVGLALSWGQVGRKTERVLRGEPVVYLVTERPCEPMEAPCAASAKDRALVLGPSGQGLALKQAGIDPAAVVGVEVVFLDAGDREISRRLLPMREGAWRLPDVPGSARALRIRLNGNVETTVGEFPLR